MTKVTFILTQDLTSPSGLGRYWPMARELTRLGHRTRVVALHSDYCSLFQKTVWKEGVEINYVAQMHVLKKGNLKAYFPLRKLCSVVLTATWKLSVSCLKDDSEIFIVGKPHPMNGIAGLLVRYIKKKVMFLDCDDYEIGVNRYSHEWQRKFAGFFENFLPRHADLVTTNTHFTMQRLLAQGVKKEKILYISNGYDEERFFPPDEEEIERLRQSLNLEGKKVIGFIGTLGITSHPVDLLIRAFLKVREVIPD